jgi:hypothetical protein
VRSAADLLNNLGNSLHSTGRFDEAISCYERALRADPNHPESHLNYAIALLTRGDLRAGFEHYEWRWRCKAYRSHRREFAQPMWDGADLRGRTILLHTEQGFGDAIQFVRYAPLVASRGAGRVILECRPELMLLLSRVEGVDRVVARKQPIDEPFDCHAPLLSLPRIFGTTLETIPARVPYLSPGRMRIARRSSDHFSIGLAWSGNPKHPNDRNRSIDRALIDPIIRLPGARTVSLQKSESLQSFDECAALIQSLDLIISVDTSIAHLAGAMGKRTWALLPFVADWRWMMNTDESPWYPTMRLLRQSQSGNWNDVIAQVIGGLTKRVRAPLDFDELSRVAA